MRRAIGTLADIAEGEVIRADQLTWLRPAWGLGPDAMGEAVGRTAKHAIKAGSLIRSEDLA
ncbi:MAG: SAF domain-containing protein [Rhodospirillaceae bacterium]